jgi:hypothetical protein
MESMLEELPPATDKSLRESEEIAPEWQELVAPESQEPEKVTPESEEIAPERQELIVPESQEPEDVITPELHERHEDRQAWNRAHSRLWPCSRCGLIHTEYRLGAMLHGLDEFNCELFIPDLDNVIMDGNTLDRRMSPNLPRGKVNLIGGELDVDEPRLRTIGTLQSLHHCSVGYHPCHTDDLATKAYPCKCNQEHKQEQEMQSNKLGYEKGSHKPMNGDTVR